MSGATDLTENFSSAVRERRREADDRIIRSGFRDPIARALASFVRSQDGEHLGYDDPDSVVVESDAKSATAKFLISTRSKDRHGDVVEPMGCANRLERYKKNPVVFFGHKSYALPVGSALDKDGNFSVSVADDGVTSSVKFHLKTAESEQVFALVDAGELRTASIGFIPLKAKIHKKKADDDDDDKPRNEVSFDPWMCFTFTEWELLEWSIVAVPANPDCVSLRLSKGIGGKALAPAVARYLEPFAAPARAWAPGAELPAPAPATTGKTRSRGRKAQAASIRELSAKIDALADAVAAVKAAPLQAATVPVGPVPVPATPTASPAGVEAEAKALLAALKQLSDRSAANAAALRRLTGKVD